MHLCWHAKRKMVKLDNVSVNGVHTAEVPVRRNNNLIIIIRLTDIQWFSDTDLSPVVHCSCVHVLFPCSDQVQQELSKVVGNRRVLVEDRKNLPYVDAVVHEVQRVANIVPMSLPHKTSRDVEFQGYFIKKVKFLTIFQKDKFSESYPQQHSSLFFSILHMLYMCRNSRNVH